MTQSAGVSPRPEARGPAGGGSLPDRRWAASAEAPGKAVLVARGFELAGLRPGARVLDLGCGQGTSVELLRRSLGLCAAGLDLSAGPWAPRAIPRVRAEARCLPIAGGALDAVLLECVLSLLPDRREVLRECGRALAPSGKLVVADLHRRGATPGGGRRDPGAWPGAELLQLEELLALLDSTGFDVLRWEDHSEVLKELLLRWILAPDETGPFPGVPCGPPPGPGAAPVGQPRPGYCLVVAARRGSPGSS